MEAMGTAFMAIWIEKETRGKIFCRQCAQDIDNDLYLPARGRLRFSNSRHWGVEIVKNLMEDARQQADGTL